VFASAALLLGCGDANEVRLPPRQNPINRVECKLTRDSRFTTGIVGQDTIAAAQCPYTVMAAGNEAQVRYRFRRTQASLQFLGCGNPIYNAVTYHPSASRAAYFGPNKFFTCEPGTQGQVYGSGVIGWPGGYGSTVLDQGVDQGVRVLAPGRSRGQSPCSRSSQSP